MKITDVKKQLHKLNTEFKFRFTYFLKYQIFTKILLSLFILPIFTFIINAILKKSGFDLLVNSQIISFGFSNAGLLVMLILYIAAIIITLIEVGGLIIINNNLITRKTSSDFYSLIIFVLKKTPNFFGIGGVVSILFIFIFISFTGINIFSYIGIPKSVPPFIKTYIDANTLFTLLYFLLMCILLYLSIIWIFSLHFILLENKTGLSALKSSSNLVKKNKKLFFTYLVTGTIATLILILIVTSIYNGFILFFSDIISHNTLWGISLLALSMFLSQIGSILLSFIIVPIIIYFLTDLFYLLNESNSKPLNYIAKKHESIIDTILKNNRTRTIFIMAFITFLVITLSITITSIKNILYDVKITAHKGNIFIAIENTLEAVEIASEQGAHYAEIDIQQSKDGQLFLFHDTNLKRILGINRSVIDLTYEEISTLDISSYGGGKLKGSKIPLLTDCISLAKDKGIKLNIELKTTTNNKAVAKKIVNILEEHHALNNCVITSFNYAVLQEIEKINPKIKTGYLTYLLKGDLNKLNVDFISIEETIATKKIIDDAHAAGMEVHVWTVNDKDNIENFINLGVDNIITDEVELSLDILKNLKEKSYINFFNQ